MILLSMLLAAAPVAAPDPQRACLNHAETARDDAGRATLRRLDTLPPAAELLTVIRAEGGCQKPVVVRTGIGGASDPRQ